MSTSRAGRFAPRIATRRPGRSTWAFLAFLVGFTVLLIVISNVYLVPALRAANEATPQEKKQLSAHATLLMFVVLVILLAGILMTVRIGRFFFPRARIKREQTKYVDAWAEAGRRMETPPEQ